MLSYREAGNANLFKFDRKAPTVARRTPDGHDRSTKHDVHAHPLQSRRAGGRPEQGDPQGFARLSEFVPFAFWEETAGLVLAIHPEPPMVPQAGPTWVRV